MDDLAIIFIYTNKCPLTDINYQSIQKYSDGAKVYAIHQNDFANNFYDFLDYRHISQWSGRDVWYWGSDNIFLYWFLSNPDKRAKQYLILEYDCYVTNSIKDTLHIDNNIIQNHDGIISANTIFAANHEESYWWFEAQRYQPLIDKHYGWNNFAAYSPLCGTMISDNAVHRVVEECKKIPLVNKIYVETKFATILKYLGFQVDNFDAGDVSLEKYITYDARDCLSHIIDLSQKQQPLTGIFHPIKDIRILERYFMNKIKKQDINQALFGQLNDVTSSLNFLKQHTDLKHFVVDNSLFGDPSPGFPKRLYLTYKKNGQIYHKIINEDEMLVLEGL